MSYEVRLICHDSGSIHAWREAESFAAALRIADEHSSDDTFTLIVNQDGPGFVTGGDGLEDRERDAVRAMEWRRASQSGDPRMTITKDNEPNTTKGAPEALQLTPPLSTEELFKAIEARRAMLQKAINERRDQIRRLHAGNKADQLAIDKLPRAPINRSRKAGK